MPRKYQTLIRPEKYDLSSYCSNKKDKLKQGTTNYRLGRKIIFTSKEKHVKLLAKTFFEHLSLDVLAAANDLVKTKPMYKNTGTTLF